MQITSGLISCDPEVDASLVTGNESVDWSQVTIGSLLIVAGVEYSITAVNPTLRTLRISPNWVGDAVVSVSYVIARDFTAVLQLPLINPGDLEVPTLISRAMRTLDGLGQDLGGDPTVSDFVISQNAHGFKIGNVLRFNGSVWSLATSVNASTSLALGIVSKVVDAGVFWLRSIGQVGSALLPIAGISLSAGQVYYLREVPTAVSDYYVNVCTGDLADTGPLKVPVMQAINANTAFILNLARALTDEFGTGSPGVVPAPPTNDGSHVLYDNGWGAVGGISLASIRAKHLDGTIPWSPAARAGQIDWDNFLARSGETPIHAFIRDLHLRMQDIEVALSDAAYSRYVFTRREYTSGSWTWVVPPGIRWARVTVLPSEAAFQQAATSIAPLASYGVSFRVGLENVSSLSGTLYTHHAVLTYNGSNPLASVGAPIRDDRLRVVPVISASSSIGPVGVSEFRSRSPYVYSFSISVFRPVSSPYIYYAQFEERSYPSLLPFYFPGQSSVPRGVLSEDYGYQYNGRFASVVIIETGLAI